MTFSPAIAAHFPLIEWILVIVLLSLLGPILLVLGLCDAILEGWSVLGPCLVAYEHLAPCKRAFLNRRLAGLQRFGDTNAVGQLCVLEVLLQSFARWHALYGVIGQVVEGKGGGHDALPLLISFFPPVACYLRLYPSCLFFLLFPPCFVHGSNNWC
ncbi:unnamed protein product [Trypanosoma congolense IL3000]|uniref:WGS project CAEQ00000000 data, annotated contig 370 n=1 Tax=Trypanosoma congolense (strain IL3000) TaxID=1068625 RepID=F9WFC6_TRYCI|nr:unnamed protein product [Trypanosoma congolense IL3000]